MSGNPRNIRILRRDKLLKTRNRRHLISSGGGPCPTITLGALNQDVFFDGTNSPNAAIFSISPAAATTYDITVVSGSLPTNTGASSVGNNSGSISLGKFLNWAFGKYTLTLRATDPDTGCFGEQTYTIEVWKSVSGSGNILSEDSLLIDLPVSGLPSSYGTGVMLDDVLINVVYNGLQNLVCNLNGPEDGYGIFTINDLSGNNLTNTKIDTTVSTAITSGAAPYTGTFKGTGFGSFAINFNGQDPNTTWQVLIDNFSSTNTGTASATLFFKPI